MKSRIAQQLNKVKYSLNSIILNLLFIERELRLKRIQLTHELEFGPHLITPRAIEEMAQAQKDNSETDDYLTKRFRDVSLEGVNFVCQ